METGSKIVKLAEMIEFANNNGYVIAAYQIQDDGKWHLTEQDIRYGSFNADAPIACKTVGQGTDFAMTNLVSQDMVFLLHNNYNLKKVVDYFNIL